MNITVPTNVVTKDQVYKTIAIGCISMAIPTVITAHASSSMGPRLSHFGHLEGLLFAGTDESCVTVEVMLFPLFADRTESNAAQQVLSHGDGKHQNGY